MWWLLGAGIGVASTFLQSEKDKERIRQQQDMARQSYEYEREYNSNMFSLQRKQSLDNLALQDSRLAQALGMDVTGMNLNLENQAMQKQAAQVSLADSKGMALAEQGASGVKGSDTLQKRIDFADSQLARQFDLQNRGTTLALQNMTTQYSNQSNDIARERQSWGPGGYRSEAKALSDTYAQNMHGLQMKGYEQAIKNAQPGVFDYITGAMNGASSGLSLENTALDFFKNYKINRDSWNTIFTSRDK
ncbi:MAG: hypothetical protein FWD78_02910 [Treponema sp.]|nr:hypothetical protein [Treponema sp.]